MKECGDIITKKLGYYKWRGERVVSNLQRIGSIVTLVGVMKVASWSLWWLLLLPPAFLIIWYIDKHLIYPGEAEASWRENPAFKKLMEKK